jgi:hypothetical protein
VLKSAIIIPSVCPVEREEEGIESKSVKIIKGDEGHGGKRNFDAVL